MEIVVTVKEIRGHCPTYKVGDSFTLKAGYQLVSDIPVCMHALACLMPYYNALRVSEPDKWGIEGLFLVYGRVRKGWKVAGRAQQLRCD